MNFKITPSSNRILDPIAIFAIVLGIIGVVSKIYYAIYPVGSQTRQMIHSAGLIGSSILAILYSLISLRGRLAMTWVDRAIYCLIPIGFLTVAYASVCASR